MLSDQRDELEASSAKIIKSFNSPRGSPEDTLKKKRSANKMKSPPSRRSSDQFEGG